MGKPRLQDVMETLCAEVVAAVNAAGITAPAQTYPGWPVSTELVEILKNGGYAISVYDRGAVRSSGRYEPIPFQLPNTNVTLTAAVAPSGETQVLTFAGTPAAGFNVHTFVGVPFRDAFYQTQISDTVDTIATAVKTAINALGVAGLSATVSGAAVTISGSPLVRCNIGNSGTMFVREINRLNREMQVSLWCPDPATRFTVDDAIESAVGTLETPIVTLSDGTPMRVLFAQSRASSPQLKDTSQSSYSLYEQHLIFDVEYGILSAPLAGADVEAARISVSTNASAPITLVTGGA